MNERSSPIVVVTGGNRGIGFEICRQLAGRGARVILTARKPDAGEAAVKKLAAQKVAAQFHPLDVTSRTRWRSIASSLPKRAVFRTWSNYSWRATGRATLL